MARYRRLTLMEREELSRMLAVGVSLRATARQMGRAPSTLAREVARKNATHAASADDSNPHAPSSFSHFSTS